MNSFDLKHLPFPGGEVDASEFVAAHAGDVTPTTITPENVEDALECLWIVGGRRLFDGERVVLLERGAELVAVRIAELTAPEAKSLMQAEKGRLLCRVDGAS